jgi:integrase
MPLNDLIIRTAKSLEKAYKLSDEKGLFLFVHPNGSKYWRLKYYFLGKEKLLALGVYPEVKLAEAREARGALGIAHRTLQHCGKVFRYALATGRAQRDIAADLRGALAPEEKGHFPTITDPTEIGHLLRAINGYHGYFATRCALRLAPMFFVRPGELRQAEWSEFNFETKEWRIPAAKMKMREMHIVPLSTQAIEILEELKPLTGNGKYLFPGIRYPDRPMSDNTLNCALRRMGYTNDEITSHSFRSMASTLLNEQGWNRDAIERQLAHGERDKIRATYNYAEYLPERRKMMQHWADYLQSLC